MQLSNNRPLRIAFANMSSTHWIAGAHYLKNLWVALRSLDGGYRPEIVLLVSHQAQPDSYSDLKPLIDQLLFWPPRPLQSDLWQRLMIGILRRVGVWLGPPPSPASDLLKHRVDCIFVSTHFGPRFSVPLLTWIPDFQHLHLPEMFSPKEIQDRSKSFSRIADDAERVILSSQSALHDFERFAPQATHKARVLSFVSQVPADTYHSDPAQVCDYYHLPRRFIYLPNQFWKHKNHEVVIQALALAKAHHPEITVVCTGSTSEHRAPLYFSKLLATISYLGLRNNLILLGFVPHAHIFQLMRQSLAVLQPSLFEGWSTTVEETKSVGKSIILSNIPVHREQDPPQAVFFDPHDPEALANCLVMAFDEKKPGPDYELEALARERLPTRTREFGRTFVEIVQEVVPV